MGVTWSNLHACRDLSIFVAKRENFPKVLDYEPLLNLCPWVEWYSLSIFYWFTLHFLTMSAQPKSFWQCVTYPPFASVALRVAFVVGSILFMINHGTALAQGKMTKERWLSGIITYVVPYMVNIHGQYSNQSR